jgi:uncharacterized membrane protein
MTCKRTPKARVLSIVSLFITIFAILIALIAPAKLTGRGQSSAKARVAPLTQSATPPLFLPAVTYVAGKGGLYNGTSSVAVADVNGDGKPDLLVANACINSTPDGTCTADGSVGVLLGNGDGTFQAVVLYDSGGQAAQSVAVADVNGDGRLDLLVTNLFSSTVGVLLGNGDGTFRSAVTYDSGGVNPFSVAVGDVNGDGKPDLVVANSNTATVGVLLGNGNGTFQSAMIYGPLTFGARSVAVADVNGDGKPDLVVGSGFFTVQVLLGNGDGTFQSGASYNSGGFGALSVAIVDVSGDGKPDLVVANCAPNASNGCGGTSANGVVGVLLGNGDGTFQSVITYDSGGKDDASVAVADVNGDGKPDALVAHGCDASGDCGNGTVGVLLGNGDGTFESAVTYNSGGLLGGGATSVAVADVNEDGKPDLLVANSCASTICTNGTVGVLLNNAPFDKTPPVITLSATPKVLWPPNGKMVRVTISGAITDTGSGVNASSAAYAVKDEYGKVQPKGRIALGPRGNYTFSVLLQASRLGADLDGRRYTIFVRAKDNAGNGGSKASVVTVPHDQGH